MLLNFGQGLFLLVGSDVFCVKLVFCASFFDLKIIFQEACKRNEIIKTEKILQDRFVFNYQRVNSKRKKIGDTLFLFLVVLMLNVCKFYD